MAGRSSWNLTTLIVAAVAAWAASGATSAHHSFGMFDMRKQVDLPGTVKVFHWTNPHSWLVLTVRDAAGNPSDVNIESHPPGALLGMGWKRQDLKPGDPVTVTVFPMRDGSPGGSLLKVVLADGRELSAMPKAPEAKTKTSQGATRE